MAATKNVELENPTRWSLLCSHVSILGFSLTMFSVYILSNLHVLFQPRFLYIVNAWSSPLYRISTPFGSNCFISPSRIIAQGDYLNINLNYKGEFICTLEETTTWKQFSSQGHFNPQTEFQMLEVFILLLCVTVFVMH